MTKPLDIVANQALGPLLKTQGFRKQARTWRRRAGDDGAIQIVNLQGSMFGTTAEGRCALNLGIYFPALAELLGVGRVSESPAEADCHLRRRAAMLRPDGHDTWFEFGSTDPASLETVASSIHELYRDFGEPWLRRFSSLASAREELERTGQTWWAAAASLSSGDKPTAATLLRKAIDRAPKDVAPHLTRWGQRYALL